MVNIKLELLNIILLPRAKHVYGYEVVPKAIVDAQKNAKLNGISKMLHLFMETLIKSTKHSETSS